jgi:dienelactone hydrolase
VAVGDPVTPRWAGPGPYRVGRVEVGRWVGVRGRSVAALVQYPLRPDDRGAAPVIVLCHGLGGDHRGYAGLGAHLAAHGYAVVHPQFLDSLALAGSELGLRDVGERTWLADERARAAMHALLFDPQHWQSRVARVHAVIDSLAGQQHLPGRLRPDHVIVAGHSFGAYTAQLVLGTTLSGVGLDAVDFAHPDVAGAILLSPQGAGDRGLTRRSWDAVDRPLLVVTATNDVGARGEGLSWRRQPFDAAPAPVKHLAVVRGGDHFLGGIHRCDTDADSDPDADFGTDAGSGAAPDPDRPVRRAVAAVALAFADLIHGDLAARDWLAGAPFPALLEHAHQEPSGG